MAKSAGTPTTVKPTSRSRAGNSLSPVERLIERSDIKVDVAACIRWFFFGLAAVLTAITGLLVAYHNLAPAASGKSHTTQVQQAIGSATKAAEMLPRWDH